MRAACSVHLLDLTILILPSHLLHLNQRYRMLVMPFLQWHQSVVCYVTSDAFGFHVKSCFALLNSDVWWLVIRLLSTKHATFFTINKLKIKLLLWLTKHHAMKTYGGSEVIALCILNLGTRCRWVVCFRPRPLYPRSKGPNIINWILFVFGRSCFKSRLRLSCMIFVAAFPMS
jgi:hypothetical protein